jgi:hypothetical protein
MAQTIYELFKLCREVNDIQKSMQYINQAVDLDPTQWVYSFEMALFIK